VRSKRRVGVLVLPRDVADPAVLEHAAAQTEGAFGPLDAWDNNAMVSVFGLVFYNGAGFPERYRDGAFVAQRGSWNRSRFSGYRVVFVPFRDGTPAGRPEDFLTGFMANPQTGEAHGRPVGLAMTADGVLLVADDAGNTVWRVQPAP
jgi:glucose/arabinose dehydrogenase